MFNFQQYLHCFLLLNDIKLILHHESWIIIELYHSVDILYTVNLYLGAEFASFFHGPKAHASI